MREHFTDIGLQRWLDTPAGLMFVAQHGSRPAAVNAIVEAEQADRAWRRTVAVGRAETQAIRFPSVDDAMVATPDPLGGGGGSLTGSTDDIVRAARRADASPDKQLRNTGMPVAPKTAVYDQDMQTGKVTLADTRPPWEREQ